MRLKLAALLLAAACLPATAQSIITRPGGANTLVVQGSISALRGTAHVTEGAEGTYIHLDIPGATRTITGFIPFGDESTFRNLAGIEGRTVVIAGVVVLDGGAEIVMTDPTQLAVIG
jgi:hypothetical protein